MACGHDSATLPLCAQLRRANSAQMREKVTMNENAEITEIFFPEVVRLTMFRHVMFAKDSLVERSAVSV